MMPTMDGFEMTQAMRADARLQHLPVIATSASVFNEDREKSMQAGCDDFLAKPIKPKVLFLMLERYLDITWHYKTIPAAATKTNKTNGTDGTDGTKVLADVANSSSHDQPNNLPTNNVPTNEDSEVVSDNASNNIN
jgi:DNA-binding response OmpR family regulator